MAQPYTRTVGLLVTQIPERPVGGIFLRIEVPALYALQSDPTVPSAALARELDLRVVHLSNGGTAILGLATPSPPLQLSGYVITFRLLMPDPRAVPIAVQLRAFGVWLDNGGASREVDAELLIEEGPNGQGELP